MSMKSLITAARTITCLLVMLLPSSLLAVQEGARGSQASQEVSQEAQMSQEAQVPQEAQASQPAEDPVMTAQRLAQMARAQALQAQISDLSNDLGTYDPALIELQSDLGRTYLELEEFELAHSVLEQGMQLVRVNDGLYGARQIELLKSLIQANLGLQAWEQVDIYANLLFDLQKRRYETDSKAYTEALISFSDWHLQASRYNLLARPGSQQAMNALQDLQDQHELMLGHARDRGDIGQQWSLLYAMASTDVEIARHFNYLSLSDFNTPAPRYVSQTVCRTVPNGSGGFQRVCWQERVNNPDYLYSVGSQRRTQSERSRIDLQATMREMEALLAENPDFAEAHAHETEQGLQNIGEALKELQRDARRSSLQRW